MAKQHPKQKALPAPKQELIQSGREAPVEAHVAPFSEIVQAAMNQAQYEILSGRTPAYAIKTRQGGGGAILKYVPHGYVRGQLNKAFGFDYDFKLLPAFNGNPYGLEIRKDKVGKGEEDVRYLTVVGEITIRIRDPQDVRKILTTIVKQDFGSQVWRASMEFGDALKAASSDALKRCGLGLGIAMDLYYDDDAANAHWARQQMGGVGAAMSGGSKKDNTPTDAIDLIARAASELNIAGEVAIKKATGKSIVDLMSLSSEEISNIWTTLMEAANANGDGAAGQKTA